VVDEIVVKNQSGSKSIRFKIGGGPKIIRLKIGGGEMGFGSKLVVGENQSGLKLVVQNWTGPKSIRLKNGLVQNWWWGENDHKESHAGPPPHNSPLLL